MSPWSPSASDFGWYTAKIDLASGLTVLLLAPEVFWPLRRVGAEFHAAQDGKTAMTKATALLDAPAALAGGTRPPTGASIRLDGVSVTSRHGDAPHRLSALVEPGAVTVLTGPNGAGKTTAVHAVLGLVAPSSGHVEVDGVDVVDLAREQWWERIAWLPQRPAFVPGTVRRNLELLGPLEDLEKACRQAGFDDVLASLPDGLDTRLGRNGSGLSLGQLQRLALTRLFGSNRPILLLDEPTAHLDEAREALILASIRRAARNGAAVLVVGHREAVRAIGDHVIDVGGEIAVIL